MTATESLGSSTDVAAPTTEEQDFLTLSVGEQMFGLPVLEVQAVLEEEVLTPIPLAPPQVAGALNLRGRIITAIDMGRLMGLVADEDDPIQHKGIVVDHDGELYNLIVDGVGDVLRVADDCFEHNPSNLDSMWRNYCRGVYRLDGDLMVVLDVCSLLASDA